jgi:hypothetical protein
MNVMVPGRECGSCKICCTIPAIDKPEIQKKAGAACRNCIPEGCAIYEARPDVCQEYFCGWRRLDMIDPDWRPDLCGVLVELDLDVPPTSSANFGLVLILVGNPLRTVREPRFVDFVARCVAGNMMVSLGLMGPVGHQSAQTRLNNNAMFEASHRSRADVKAQLEKVLKRLQAHTFIPYDMVNSGHDFSAG